MPRISVCIPTYEMHGRGADFLKQSFDMLRIQTYTDFDIIVSDHSQDNAIKTLCETYNSYFPINYIQNSAHRGNSSANINNAIRHATGMLIKILFQDDFLYDKHSLAYIAQHFDLTKDTWLVTGCTHTKDGTHFFRPLIPKYTRDVHLGNNIIGSPSVLTIRNSDPLFFDETLLWLMDGEYYKRLFDRYGPPHVVSQIGVVNRIGTHQVTHTSAGLTRRREEYKKVLHTYEHGIMKLWYTCFYTAQHIAKVLLRHD